MHIIRCVNEPGLGPPTYKRSGECAVRTVGDETILVPIRSHVAELESVFLTNDVGRAIWEMLETPQAVDRLVERVVESFEVSETDARRDVGEFVAALLEARLVEPEGAPA